MKKDPYRRIVWIYDLVAEPPAGILRRIALEVYPPQENIYILDAGCGTGTQLELLSRPGCKLYGVDTSAAMLDAARPLAFQLRIRPVRRNSYVKSHTCAP